MILTKKIVEKNNLIDKNGHCIVPDCYTIIGKSTFEDHINLVSIKLPDSVVKIESSAFWSCIKLKSIEMSNSLINIEDFAFYNCTSLKSIELPDSVIIIGTSIFWGCISLPKINVENEILEVALRNSHFELRFGLEFYLEGIVRNLILKYKKPICMKVELPMFTIENAILHANGRGLWFENSSARKKFLEWMLSEIGKRNINDEILILRR